MKAITVRQPWASLITAGVKTIETRPRPTSYRGRIAIHAGKASPLRGDGVHDPWDVLSPKLSRVTNGHDGWQWRRRHPFGPWTPLPRGAVVGSAVLTDCVPIGRCHDPYAQEVPAFAVAVHWDNDKAWHVVGDTAADITDQLPFGDFTPGRWALLLAEAKPTTQRCPWCWGEGAFPIEENRGCWCEVCDGDSACDPVPARGHSGLWEWTP